MNRPLPSGFKYSAVWWTIQEIEAPSFDKFGYTSWQDLTIYIKKNIHQSAKWQALFHEIRHVIEFSNDLGLEKKLGEDFNETVATVEGNGYYEIVLSLFSEILLE